MIGLQTSYRFTVVLIRLLTFSSVLGYMSLARAEPSRIPSSCPNLLASVTDAKGIQHNGEVTCKNILNFTSLMTRGKDTEALKLLIESKVEPKGPDKTKH